MSDFMNKTNRAKHNYDMQSESESINPASPDDIDMSVLTGFEEAQCKGEPDLIVELIDLYLANVPQQLSAMKVSVLKADEISLKRAAHTLKGSSANLGVKCVATLCEEIEQTDSSESFQQSNILINRLEQTFLRVRPVFLAERQSRA